MKRALILVEGVTEERFIKDVLQPHFHTYDMHIEPTLLVTKVVKAGTSFKGGVTTYGKFRNDAMRLIAGSGGALVTTMLDYYGLPGDFPGMADRPNGPALSRVHHVEQAIHADLGSAANFYPFLTLHEFEALLFVSPDELSRTILDPNSLPLIRAVREQFSSPEEINEGPATAPSKRLEAICSTYRKTLHGPIAALRMGLDVIRADCPHFDRFITSLENRAVAD